ncbi:hypothetical protein RWK44_33745 [Rhizobium sp. 25PS6]|nr:MULTISPECIES: hypothetical protein [Rhizobium]MDU0365335.1 hypothetical protein [Rhizobium sp. 25PS6]
MATILDTEPKIYREGASGTSPTIYLARRVLHPLALIGKSSGRF